MADLFPRVDPSGAASAARVVAEMAHRLPAERLFVLGAIEDAYCRSCGDAQPEGKRRCQCWRDE